MSSTVRKIIRHVETLHFTLRLPRLGQLLEEEEDDIAVDDLMSNPAHSAISDIRLAIIRCSLDASVEIRKGFK